MQVQNKKDILIRLKQNKETLKNFGVIEVGLFGSFVRSEQSENSDVDLLVAFDREKKSFRNFMNFADYIESLLGRKVEVVTPESLSPYIGPYIRKETEYVKISD